MGTRGGLNAAVLPCIVPQVENSGANLTLCSASAYDNIQEDANQDNLHLIRLGGRLSNCCVRPTH